MFAEVENMPGDARVWIYQCERLFTPEEEEKIILLGKEFVNSWTAHHRELKAAFQIRYHAFIFLMIDGKHAEASGCSIDKSLHFIQKLEKEFSVSLLNRFIFALKENNGVRLLKKDEFTSMIERKIITDESIVFNNLAETKNDVDTKWEIPFKYSWHKKVMA